MMSESSDNMKSKCHWEQVKRRLDPGSMLFEEGDAYCRCLQKCLPADEKDADLMSGYVIHVSYHLLFSKVIIYEPRREKTGFLHMRKQRRRSAFAVTAKLISAFVFACFRYTDITIPLLPKSEISSL